MPLPTAGDVHVNAPLTNISIAYIQNANNYVATRVFQLVPSEKQSDRYFEYNRADFLRDEMQVRAPATESAGAGYRLDNTPNFFCDVWSLHKDVDDQVRSNQDAAIDADRDATEFLTQKALIRRDRQFATQYMTTGVWSQDITPTTKWDAAGGTPIQDIRDAIFDVEQSTGFRPNVLTLGARAWQAIQDSADFLGRVAFGTNANPSLVTPNLLASVLELDEVLISRAVYATSNEGDATPSFAYINGDVALLTYRPARPSLLTPAAGYTFSWTGYLGAGRDGVRIKRFRMEHLSSDRVEIEAAFDQKLVSADLGVFFNDVLTG